MSREHFPELILLDEKGRALAARAGKTVGDTFQLGRLIVGKYGENKDKVLMCNVRPIFADSENKFCDICSIKDVCPNPFGATEIKRGPIPLKRLLQKALTELT
jgi:hypothetical protein